MISITNSVEIERPVDDVFQYVADLENAPSWNEAIAKTTNITAGPVRVGTKYRQYRDSPKPVAEVLEVITFRPNERLEVVGRLADNPAHVTYLFEETEAGTRLINDIELEPEGVLLRLVTPLLTTRIKGAVADNLEELKNILETAA